MLQRSFTLLVGLMFCALAVSPAAAELTPKEKLGKELFFDSKLSSPNNQSCAACHADSSGFTGAIAGINSKGAVYPGAVRQRFGNRKPPTAAYAGDSPIFHYDAVEGLFIGGMFWDGRATGWVTGDPLADQAMGPYLNPVEQNLPSQAAACMIVAKSTYAPLYTQAFGMPINCTVLDSDGNLRDYKNFARAVAAFERSSEVSRLSSKFDAVMAMQAEFSPQEAAGWELFNGKARCALCHPAPLFTDFSYDNLGVPKNPEKSFLSHGYGFRRWPGDQPRRRGLYRSGARRFPGQPARGLVQRPRPREGCRGRGELRKTQSADPAQH